MIAPESSLLAIRDPTKPMQELIPDDDPKNHPGLSGKNTDLIRAKCGKEIFNAAK